MKNSRRVAKLGMECSTLPLFTASGQSCLLDVREQEWSLEQTQSGLEWIEQKLMSYTVIMSTDTYETT